MPRSPGPGPGTSTATCWRRPGGELSRIDPYAREVTDSAGNGVIHDPSAFDWGPDAFRMAPRDELVIYELHIGTFHDKGREDGRPGTFQTATEQLEHLGQAGDQRHRDHAGRRVPRRRGPGATPRPTSSPSSRPTAGPRPSRRSSRNATGRGIAVILDVVYNHFGPKDVDLWRFDGWSENDLGGIYFFNDWRAETPWGHSRPDYTRGRSAGSSSTTP